MTRAPGLAAAVFLFNHKYQGNVARLDSFYGDRFRHRQFLMPFGTSDDPRVLRAVEASWYFSGHVAQTGARLVRDPAITHYAFIADDLIVNPSLGETSLIDALDLGPDSGFIKSIAGADELRYRWPWAGEAAMSIRKFGRGFDYRAELPPADVAQRRFEAMGLRFPFPRPRSAHELVVRTAKTAVGSPWAFLMGLGVTGRRADYPILAGYSDFFVVPATALDRFVDYCGVFAAMNVFAEVAIPTALALSVGDLRTEMKPGEFFIDPPSCPPPSGLRGVEFWEVDESAEFAERFDKSLDRLRTEFPADWLYVHPVKLSQWT